MTCSTVCSNSSERAQPPRQPNNFNSMALALASNLHICHGLLNHDYLTGANIF
jgi:hypothetical protein